LAASGVQLSTGTLVVLFGVQVVEVKVFPALAGLGVHEETPTGPVVIGAGQVVVVKLLPAAATAGVQLATATLVVVIGGGQVIVV
jgi:uncharacterized membrane protein